MTSLCFNKKEKEDIFFFFIKILLAFFKKKSLIGLDFLFQNFTLDFNASNHFSFFFLSFIPPNLVVNSLLKDNFLWIFF